MIKLFVLFESVDGKLLVDIKNGAVNWATELHSALVSNL